MCFQKKTKWCERSLSVLLWQRQRKMVDINFNCISSQFAMKPLSRYVLAVNVSCDTTYSIWITFTIRHYWDNSDINLTSSSSTLILQSNTISVEIIIYNTKQEPILSKGLYCLEIKKACGTSGTQQRTPWEHTVCNTCWYNSNKNWS